MNISKTEVMVCKKEGQSKVQITVSNEVDLFTYLRDAITECGWSNVEVKKELTKQKSL